MNGNDSILSHIQHGSIVTILVHGGLKIVDGKVVPEYIRKTGTAVMRGPAGWVLNMGGRHGTPGIATDENTVQVKLPRVKRTAKEKLRKVMP